MLEEGHEGGEVERSKASSDAAEEMVMRGTALVVHSSRSTTFVSHTTRLAKDRIKFNELI